MRASRWYESFLSFYSDTVHSRSTSSTPEPDLLQEDEVPVPLDQARFTLDGKPVTVTPINSVADKAGRERIIKLFSTVFRTDDKNQFLFGEYKIPPGIIACCLSLETREKLGNLSQPCLDKVNSLFSHSYGNSIKNLGEAVTILSRLICSAEKQEV